MARRVLVCLFAAAFIVQVQLPSAVAEDSVLGIRAPESYGYLKTPEMGDYKIKRLVNQLYDRSKRMDAQRDLATYGTRVTQYVLPLLDDKNNESVRVAALNIIGRVNDPSAEDKVVEMLRDPDPRVRREAAQTLSVIGSKASSIEPLKRNLKDYHSEVRYNALKALARLAPEEETDLFISALGDYDPRIRRFAVVALGNLKSEKAVPYLSQMVAEPAPDVRMQLTKTFAEINTQDCVQPLEWLINDPDAGIRMAAIERISELNAQGVDEILIEASDNPDPRIASKAIEGLARRKNPKALEVAKQHLNDEHMLVKMASIDVVGQMGSTKDKELLKPLMQAESSRVRNKAREVLEEEYIEI